jgi:hypothetical protein
VLSLDPFSRLIAIVRAVSLINDFDPDSDLRPAPTNRRAGTGRKSSLQQMRVNFRLETAALTKR